jgi:hypothetical protein
MSPRNGPRDAKTQTGSTCIAIARAFAALEGLEHRFELGNR